MCCKGSQRRAWDGCLFSDERWQKQFCESGGSQTVSGTDELNIPNGIAVALWY